MFHLLSCGQDKWTLASPDFDSLSQLLVDQVKGRTHTMPPPSKRNNDSESDTDSTCTCCGDSWSDSDDSEADVEESNLDCDSKDTFYKDLDHSVPINLRAYLDLLQMKGQDESIMRLQYFVLWDLTNASALQELRGEMLCKLRPFVRLFQTPNSIHLKQPSHSSCEAILNETSE